MCCSASGGAIAPLKPRHFLQELSLRHLQSLPTSQVMLSGPLWQTHGCCPMQCWDLSTCQPPREGERGEPGEGGESWGGAMGVTGCHQARPRIKPIESDRSTSSESTLKSRQPTPTPRRLNSRSNAGSTGTGCLPCQMWHSFVSQRSALAFSVNRRT